jgi:hypothetical protein
MSRRGGLTVRDLAATPSHRQVEEGGGVVAEQSTRGGGGLAVLGRSSETWLCRGAVKLLHV